jgi:hypothetical protein
VHAASYLSLPLPPRHATGHLHHLVSWQLVYTVLGVCSLHQLLWGCTAHCWSTALAPTRMTLCFQGEGVVEVMYPLAFQNSDATCGHILIGMYIFKAAAAYVGWSFLSAHRFT